MWAWSHLLSPLQIGDCPISPARERSLLHPLGFIKACNHGQGAVSLRPCRSQSRRSRRCGRRWRGSRRRRCPKTSAGRCRCALHCAARDFDTVCPPGECCNRRAHHRASGGQCKCAQSRRVFSPLPTCLHPRSLCLSTWRLQGTAARRYWSCPGNTDLRVRGKNYLAVSVCQHMLAYYASLLWRVSQLGAVQEDHLRVCCKDYLVASGCRCGGEAWPWQGLAPWLEQVNFGCPVFAPTTVATNHALSTPSRTRRRSSRPYP